MLKIFKSRTIMYLYVIVPIILLFISSNGFAYANIYIMAIVFIYFFYHYVLIIQLSHFRNLNNLNNLNIYIFSITVLSILFNIIINQDALIFNRDIISTLIVLLFLFELLFLKLNMYDLLVTQKSISNIKKISIFQLLISIITFIIYLFDKSKFSGVSFRFQGWSQSPTTFSIYLLFFCFISMIIIPQKKLRVLLLILYSVMIYYTGTRTSIICCILLIFIFVPRFIAFLDNKLPLIVISLFIVFIFSEFIFDQLMNIGLGLLNERYSSEIDNSKITRVLLYERQLNVIKTSGLLSFIIGNGIGHTQKVLNYFNSDIKLLAHNDLLKITIDYGVLFITSFFIIMIKSFKIYWFGSIPIIIYLTSFFHNMAFDHFTLVLLLLSFYIISHRVYFLKHI